VKRASLSFADINIGFADREIALRQIMELAERGTYPVYIVVLEKFEGLGYG